MLLFKQSLTNPDCFLSLQRNNFENEASKKAILKNALLFIESQCGSLDSMERR